MPGMSVWAGRRDIFFLAHALAASGLPASCLVLEVTESVLAVNASLWRDQLSRLKLLGVGLAMDDFAPARRWRSCARCRSTS